MRDTHNRLAGLLRTPVDALIALEGRMNRITGQEGVFEDIIRQNDIIVERTLVGLGLTQRDPASVVHEALIERLGHLDRHLYDLLDKPDLSKPIEACEKLCKVVTKVFMPPRGLFIKHDRVLGMLEKYPPHGLVEMFGYASIKELVDKEGMGPVLASLRFTQTNEWMHQFFEVAYRDIQPDDFEERDVDHFVMDPKWSDIAGKFMAHKHHNVSHLKEFGIIFIEPISLSDRSPGATLRMFTLILHYLHEVPFYAGLIGHAMTRPDFAPNFRSLLRGDVPSGPLPNGGRAVWRVVQRYLAKDNENDFRLFEPHVNPEADHWWRAEEDLSRLSRILGRDHGGLDLGWWSGLDFVGSFFPGSSGHDELVSFDLIDLIMSLVVSKGESKYLYHQQEALWNKIFIEYLGRERMNQLITEHIIDGFIDLTPQQ
jgi:hypothetical protein